MNNFFDNILGVKPSKKKPKTDYICSAVLGEEIIEVVYNSKDEETMFAVWNNGKLEYREEIILPSGRILKPLQSDKDIIKNRVVLFPTEPEDYGTDKDLIKDIQGFIHKYLQISSLFEEILSYYVLFSWIHDKFSELPYVRFIGTWGTGKSRAEKTIGALCYKPIFCGGAITASPVFRILEQVRGTLVVDEADFRVSDNWAEIVKILNCGHEKNSPVLRSEGKNTQFETKAFFVYGPKILATRKVFEDQALESRCLTEEMMGKTRGDIPINLPDEFWPEAAQIRNKLLMWRFKNFHQTILHPELEDKTIEPRLNQVMIPLLSVIQDEEARQKIRNFIKQYNSELLFDRGMEFGAEVLRAIIGLIKEGNKEPTMKEIANALNVSYGREDYNYRGKKFNPKQIGHVVRKDLKIKPQRTMDGYIVPESEKARIDYLRERFGIKEELEDKTEEELRKEADRLAKEHPEEFIPVLNEDMNI